MEIFGNINGLKTAVEKKYAAMIREVEKEKEKELSAIKKQSDEKLRILKSHMQTTIEQEAAKEYSKIISNERLKSKKEFEEKRELLITRAFEEAKSREFIRSKPYIEFVKGKAPKSDDSSVIVGDAYLKKQFTKAKLDKNINGVRIESKDAVYDFSLEALIDAKKELLRHEVNIILFG